MKKIKTGITLTKEQKKHLKTLQWLLTGPRQSGRSMLLAHTYIEHVLTTHQPIEIKDHYPSHGADLFLIGTVEDVISKNNLPLAISINGVLKYYPDGDSYTPYGFRT